MKHKSLTEEARPTPTVGDQANTEASAAPIATAMLQCFDEQIDDMGPDPEFKTAHRAALIAELERFDELLS